MSNFMFLFRGGETPTSPERMQAQMQKWMNWIQKLRNDGKYIAGDPLQGTGKVLRSPNSCRITSSTGNSWTLMSLTSQASSS